MWDILPQLKRFTIVSNALKRTFSLFLPFTVRLKQLKNEDNEFDVEKYNNELASLRRIAIQLNELRRWLLNTSLASLAFAITVMFQVKKGSIVPNSTLAAFTIGLLILAVIGGIFIRGKNELVNFMGDAKGFFSLLPVINDMLKKSPEISAADKLRIANYFDRAINFAENEYKDEGGWSPYADLFFIAIEFVVLIMGLGSLCIYVWFYLFGM